MADKVDISVITVSYNCRMVLQMMLTSLSRAAEGLSVQCIVADNRSTDGTIDLIHSNFPWVETIDCGSNLGFGKANNLALERATGRIILLLNPDTVIPENLLGEITKHFDNEPNSGAVGVRMIDGDGLFARESKRGRMTPAATFYKITGLWKLAPQSPKFSAYYAGHIAEREVAQVPVLSGACVAFRRETYEQNGGFDAEYFMYGEDIDLSLRYNDSTAGNTYHGDLTIIHFKGESTPPKLRYIGHFYKAMLIFSRKHEFQNHNFLVNIAVAIGIGLAYAMGVMRCIATRIKKGKPFCMPQKVFLVSNNEASIKAFNEKFKNEVEAITFDSLNSLILNYNTSIIFDIEAGAKQAIDFIESNSQRARFGFYSAKACTAFMYHAKSCKSIF